MKKHKTFLYKKIFMLLLCLILATPQVAINAITVYADEPEYEWSDSGQSYDSDDSDDSSDSGSYEDDDSDSDSDSGATETKEVAPQAPVLETKPSETSVETKKQKNTKIIESTEAEPEEHGDDEAEPEEHIGDEADPEDGYNDDEDIGKTGIGSKKNEDGEPEEHIDDKAEPEEHIDDEAGAEENDYDDDGELEINSNNADYGFIDPGSTFGSPIPNGITQPSFPPAAPSNRNVLDDLLNHYDKNKENYGNILPPTSPSGIFGRSIDDLTKVSGKRLDEVGKVWIDAAKTIIVEITGAVTPSEIVDPLSPVQKLNSIVKTGVDAINDIKKGEIFNGVTKTIDNIANVVGTAPFPPTKIAASAIKGATSIARAIHKTIQEKGCLKGDVLITMADGTVKAVKDIKSGDMVLTWNFYKGEAEPQPVVFNDIIAEKKYTVAYVTFDDGTTVGVVGEHGFFDLDAGEYVYFNVDASDYLGHTFAKMDDDGNRKEVKLTDVELADEKIEIYSPVSAKNFCICANGMLSMPGDVHGFFNYFDVDTDEMKYDEGKMAADIEKYGTYSYEDFSEILSEEMYDAFDLKYMKVSVGKGLISWRDIEKKIEKYNEYLK